MFSLVQDNLIYFCKIYKNLDEDRCYEGVCSGNVCVRATTTTTTTTTTQAPTAVILQKY